MIILLHSIIEGKRTLGCTAMQTHVMSVGSVSVDGLYLKRYVET